MLKYIYSGFLSEMNKIASRKKILTKVIERPSAALLAEPRDPVSGNSLPDIRNVRTNANYNVPVIGRPY